MFSPRTQIVFECSRQHFTRPFLVCCLSWAGAQGDSSLQLRGRGDGVAKVPSSLRESDGSRDPGGRGVKPGVGSRRSGQTTSVAVGLEVGGQARRLWSGREKERGARGRQPLRTRGRSGRCLVSDRGWRPSCTPGKISTGLVSISVPRSCPTVRCVRGPPTTSRAKWTHRSGEFLRCFADRFGKSPLKRLASWSASLPPGTSSPPFAQVPFGEEASPNWAASRTTYLIHLVTW